MILFMLRSHLYKLSDHQFAGYLEINKAWHLLRAFSCGKAMLRFTIWFSSKVYLQIKFESVKKFYDTFHDDYKYIGLTPVDNLKVFLDILPEILTMMLATLIIYRIEVVEYTSKNRANIEEAISDDKFVGYAADMSKRVTRLSKISQSVILKESSHKKRHSFAASQKHRESEGEEEKEQQGEKALAEIDDQFLGVP